MPDFLVRYKVECSECHSALQTNGYTERGHHLIDVRPCPTCIKAAADEGYAEAEKDHLDEPARRDELLGDCVRDAS